MHEYQLLKWLYRLCLTWVCMGYGLLTFAASPPDSGQLLQQQRAVEHPLRSGLPEAASPVPATPTPNTSAPDTQSDIEITVHTVYFTGHDHLATTEELHATIAADLQRPLGMGQLDQLTEKVSQFLKSKGWVLARAYLPPQELSSGELHIAIAPGLIEGGYSGGGIHVQGNLHHIAKDRIQSIMAHALFPDPKQSAFHGGRMERGVLLLNDLAGIQAHSTLEKGTETGSTQINLQIDEGPQWGGSLMLDNQGNPYTGTERGTAQFFFNNPSGEGDQINASTAVASHLKLLTLGYNKPIGYQGVLGKLLYTHLNYEMGGALANSESKGSAATYLTELSWPWVRSRQANFRMQTSLEHKILHDESLGEVQKDRRINNWLWGVNGDHSDDWQGGGISNFWATGTWGMADYSRVATDVETDAVAGTQGRFHKLQLGLSRTQQLAAQWSLFASLTAQFADHNLPSSEKFSLGGPSGVRAYPGGEGSGDAGQLLNLELRYDTPVSSGQLQWSAFIDAGSITLNKSPWTDSPGNASNRNQYHLAGIGVGITYTSPGRYQLKAVWGHRLGENPGRSIGTDWDSDGKKTMDRLWLTTTVMF